MSNATYLKHIYVVNYIWAMKSPACADEAKMQLGKKIYSVLCAGESKVKRGPLSATQLRNDNCGLPCLLQQL